MNDVEIIPGRLEKIRQDMLKENKEITKRMDQVVPRRMAQGGQTKQDASNKIRINNFLVLEARKELIAAAVDIQEKSPDEAQDAFWLINEIKPIRFIVNANKQKPENQVELEITRIQDDIDKLSRKQLKKGAKVLITLTIGEFKLRYWPTIAEKGVFLVKPRNPIKGPTKRFAYFQNFEIPPPALSRKVNPYTKKQVEYLVFEKGYKYKLTNPIPKKLRKVVFDHLYTILDKIKGYDKVSEDAPINDKNEFVKQRIKELFEKGDVQVKDDILGKKMVDDILANIDNDLLVASILIYQIKRLNPNIYTRDTILSGRKVVSVGLLPTLQYGKTSIIGNTILGFLQRNEQLLTKNYRYIKEFGINPWATDADGIFIFMEGIETTMFQLIGHIVINNKATWTREILNQFIVGDVQQRITFEQIDAINKEWDDMHVDDENEVDTANDDIKDLKDTLSQQVDDLENNFYAGAKNQYRSATSSDDDEDSHVIGPYILAVATLTSQLSSRYAQNLKLRIQNGSLPVPTLAYIDKEEMLPELYMNNQIISDAKFIKWFNNQIYEEANLILEMWNQHVKDPFPIGMEPVAFKPEQNMVANVCDANRFYVKTKDGIECMSSQQILQNLDALRPYNRKDLEMMIQ
jgi:hypothetical protein